jgi:hypothetical protein
LKFIFLKKNQMDNKKDDTITLEKNPESITLCNLQVVVMPTGEIICAGKTIGYVSQIGEFLTVVKQKNGRLNNTRN